MSKKFLGFRVSAKRYVVVTITQKMMAQMTVAVSCDLDHISMIATSHFVADAIALLRWKAIDTSFSKKLLLKISNELRP